MNVKLLLEILQTAQQNTSNENTKKEIKHYISYFTEHSTEDGYFIELRAFLLDELVMRVSAHIEAIRNITDITENEQHDIVNRIFPELIKYFEKSDEALPYDWIDNLIQKEFLQLLEQRGE